MLEKNRLLFILLTLISLLSFVAGCGRKPEQKQVPSPKVIGVSLVTEDKDLKSQFKKAMDENAKENGLKIIWKESKPQTQEEDVKELLDRKVKVLVIELADETAAAAIVREAKTKDVPVLALSLMPQNVPLDGFIGIDAYRSGLQQGDFLAQALRNQSVAKVLIVKGLDHSFEELISQGNLEGLKKHPNIQATVLEILPHENIETKLAALENLGDFQGLLIHNPVWTEKAISLLEDLDLDRKMVTVGLGASKQSIKAIMNGSHEAEIDLDPKLLGKYAFAGAKQLAEEGQWQFEKLETSGSYDIPVKYLPANVITQENIYLVEKRFKDLLGQEAPAKEENTSKQSGGSNSGQQEQKQEGNKSKVVIQTKEGKTMEVEVEGEVLKVEIQGAGSEAGKKGGQESQGSS